MRRARKVMPWCVDVSHITGWVLLLRCINVGHITGPGASRCIHGVSMCHDRGCIQGASTSISLNGDAQFATEGVSNVTRCCQGGGTEGTCPPPPKKVHSALFSISKMCPCKVKHTPFLLRKRAFPSLFISLNYAFPP